MDPSHPGGLPPPVLCLSSTHLVWVDRQATETSGFWVASPLTWLSVEGPFLVMACFASVGSGMLLPGGILGVELGEQGRSSVRL